MLIKPSSGWHCIGRNAIIASVALFLGLNLGLFTESIAKAQYGTANPAPWQQAPGMYNNYQTARHPSNAGKRHIQQTAYSTDEASPPASIAKTAELVPQEDSQSSVAQEDSASDAYDESGDYSVSGSYTGCGDECGSSCDMTCRTPCFPILASLEDRLWIRAEYLAWWNKTTEMPALATTSPVGTPRNLAGVLGQPNTSVLFGNGNVNEGVSSGGRLALSYWFNDCQDRGLEVVYTFLGNKSTGFTGNSDAYPILARPFNDVDTRTLGQTADLVAYPSFTTGALDINLNNEFQAIEILSRRVLVQDCNRQLDFLVGYRYSRFLENLTINEISTSISGSTPVPVGTVTRISDIFGAKNEFNGAEIGFAAKTRHCRWTMELLGKMAMGSTQSRVTINGSTTVAIPNQPVATYTSGLLALPTNSGVYDQNNFTVIPELGMTVGYDITCRLRATVGYTFLYWSKIVRPADQIDMNVNSSQLPPGTLSGVSAPTFNFTTTDFWTQGINAGLEYHF